MTDRSEGWVLMDNARKWHFFATDGRSLCGRWAFLGDVQPSISVNADACSACGKQVNARAQRKAKAAR